MIAGAAMAVPDKRSAAAFEAKMIQFFPEVGQELSPAAATHMDLASGRVALALGTESNLFGRHWSQTLAEAAVLSPFEPFDPATFGPWLKSCREKWTKRIEGIGLAWFEVAALAQACPQSSLEWIHVVSAEPDAWQLLAFMVGDCCLLHYHDGALAKAFPSPDQVDASPAPTLLDGSDRHRDELLRPVVLRERCAAGDILILCTAAIARWALRCQDSGSAPNWDRYWNATAEQLAADAAVVGQQGKLEGVGRPFVIVRVGGRSNDDSHSWPRATIALSSEEPAEVHSASDAACSDDALIEQLIDRWEDLRSEGRQTIAEELCCERPDLLERLKERLSVLEAMDWLEKEGKSPCKADSLANMVRPFPRTLGRYRLDELVGTGGFGQVWKGFDPQLQRVVAIKVPRPDRLILPDQAEWFLGEARKVASLRHPGIIPVHDVGQDGDWCFIVSDFVEGGNLAQRIAGGCPSWEESARLVSEVADILQYAHDQGFVHRDIKPANIMLDTPGHPYLVDFGVALSKDERKDHVLDTAGTLSYASPEQVREGAGKIDSRADLYSLGLVFYELLTGRHPFTARKSNDLLVAILHHLPKSTRFVDPDIPPMIDEICLRLLAKEPANRFQSAQELAEVLREVLESESVASHGRKTSSRPVQKRGSSNQPDSSGPTMRAIPTQPTPASSDHQPPVGIDLGTTYSVVAYLDGAGRPATVTNRTGDLLTPSAVAFEEGSVIVGKEAIRSSVFIPDKFTECFKRDMGRANFRRPVVGQHVPPEVLNAFLLDRLRQDAEKHLGPVQRVVITVPAFFDETRRKATQAAGRLAGLEVLDIINEPTAAALAFGYGRSLMAGPGSANELDERVLVYDLGGGTFDVTLIEIKGNHFRTLATDGDVQLGGKDFDERLVNHVAGQFMAQHGSDPRSDAQDAAQLWLDVQDAKHALSERLKTTITCFHAGIRSRVEVTRETFEKLTRDLLGRTEFTASLVLKQAQMTWSDIDRILLVGGATRMPMVGEMLRRISGKEPDRSQSADEVVAHGAALYAGAIMADRSSQQKPRFELVNVNSHSLGVVGVATRTRERTNAIVIPKNTPLPCRRVRYFRTAKADQASVCVPVVEGESLRPEQCIALGQCIVRDLPPGLPGGTRVEVEFQYATNGRLSVSARIPAVRQSATVEVASKEHRKLASLSEWQKRLCSDANQKAAANAGQQLPPASNDPRLNTTTDRPALLKRLNDLFAWAGAAAASKPLPAPLAAVQQTIFANQEQYRHSESAMQQAEQASKSALGVHETARLMADVLRARTNVEYVSAQLRNSYILLGREAIARNLPLPEMAPYLDELRRLQQLASAGT
jgi:molecular chaperone DnaK